MMTLRMRSVKFPYSFPRNGEGYRADAAFDIATLKLAGWKTSASDIMYFDKQRVCLEIRREIRSADDLASYWSTRISDAPPTKIGVTFYNVAPAVRMDNWVVNSYPPSGDRPGVLKPNFTLRINDKPKKRQREFYVCDGFQIGDDNLHLFLSHLRFHEAVLSWKPGTT